MDSNSRIDMAIDKKDEKEEKIMEQEVIEEEMIRPEVDIFKHIYFKLKPKLEDEFQAMQRDLTQELKLWIKQKIRRKELIVANLRGEVGSGKSTAALSLFKDANDEIMVVKQKKIDYYKWIASDQIEFLRMSRTDEEDVCVEVDEFSALGRTGANASTEMAEYEFFSDVCRIQYIHRISCSPVTVMDKNATVILDIIGAVKEKKMTKVKVTYRNVAEQYSRVIGTAWIDVSNVLDEDWYRRYEVKKKMRTRLLKDYGVRDIREMEFAAVSLDAIKELKPLAEIRKCTLPQIRTTIQNVVREKYRQRISYLAEDEIAKPTFAIIDNIHSLTKAKTPIERQLITQITQKSIDSLIKLKQGLADYMMIE